MTPNKIFTHHSFFNFTDFFINDVSILSCYNICYPEISLKIHNLIQV